MNEKHPVHTEAVERRREEITKAAPRQGRLRESLAAIDREFEPQLAEAIEEVNEALDEFDQARRRRDAAVDRHRKLIDRREERKRAASRVDRGGRR